MADGDTPTTSTSSKGGTFGFLTRKVGPIPVWGWAAIGFGVYYWYTHYGPGKSSASSSTGASGTPPAGASTIVVEGGGGGGDTDTDHGGSKPPTPQPGDKDKGGGGWKSITVPKQWDGWTLDQIASYLHWTPQTKADVIKNNAIGGKMITGKTKFKTGDVILRPLGAAKDEDSRPQDQKAQKPSGPSSMNANPYSNNPDVPATGTSSAASALNTYQLTPGTTPGGTAVGWEAAAINYLIGEGVPPDQASTSIWSYLHQEPLSSRMQANVNLATDGIGAPPGEPGPALTVANLRPKRNTPRRKAA